MESDDLEHASLGLTYSLFTKDSQVIAIGKHRFRQVVAICGHFKLTERSNREMFGAPFTRPQLSVFDHWE